MHRQQDHRQRLNSPLPLILFTVFTIGFATYLIWHVSGIDSRYWLEAYSFDLDTYEQIEGIIPERLWLEVSGDYDGAPLWEASQVIDIFGQDSEPQGKSLVAPGSAGQYSFKVTNPTGVDLSYNLSIEAVDDGRPQLPLLYKLKSGRHIKQSLGGKDWKQAEDLPTPSYGIEPGETHYFTLEWQWITNSDSEDTRIGTQQNRPDYTLSIIISATDQGMDDTETHTEH